MTFYIIWNPESPRTPTVKHSTKEAAQQEAVRLAEMYPGQTFYVMKQFGSAKAEKPSARYVDQDGMQNLKVDWGQLTAKDIASSTITDTNFYVGQRVRYKGNDIGELFVSNLVGCEGIVIKSYDDGCIRVRFFDGYEWLSYPCNLEHVNV